MRLFARIAAVGLVLFAVPAVAQEGITYNVVVTTSEGAKFEDCFTFNDDGTMEIFQLNDALTWSKHSNGSKNNTFIAVSVLDNEDQISLAFSGKAKTGTLKADGLNGDTLAFKLKGKAGACELTRRADGPNPWLFPELAGR